jgi:hypothetical protein
MVIPGNVYTNANHHGSLFKRDGFPLCLFLKLQNFHENMALSYIFMIYKKSQKVTVAITRILAYGQYLQFIDQMNNSSLKANSV